MEEPWLDEETGAGDPQPIARRNPRLSLEPGEQVYLHEKGTLYATAGAALGGVSREGRPSDVAFPHFKRPCCRIQRTHVYATDRRLVFVGKDLFKPVAFSELKSFSDTPGGIVFELAGPGAEARLAFTFQNPLIVADVLRYVMKGVK